MLRVLIRLVLLAWPAHMRVRHGRALAQTLTASWHAETRTPRPARWLRRGELLVDAVVSGRAARRDVRRRPRESAWRALAADAGAAWRTLTRRPAFAAVVIATLGVGLGSATAIYAVVDAVLVRPLPYPDDHRLVWLGQREPGRNLEGASFPEIEAWSEFPEIGSLAAWDASLVVFAEGGQPERVAGASVTPGFFGVMRVAPLEGRALRADRAPFSGDQEVVLGESLWRRRFGAETSVIGRVLTLEGRAFTIVGVMPAAFRYPAGAEFWRTLPDAMRMMADSPSLRFMNVVARLSPEATVEDLAQRLAAWRDGQPRLDLDAGEGWRPFVRSLRDASHGAVRPALLAVSAGVMLLLLVSCANVTALLLAHGRSRGRDLATRAALGATRRRLVRQVLIEGALLSLGAATLAVMATRLTSGAIIALSADQIPRIDQIDVGPGVIGFAAAVALAAAILVGLAPAWSLSRTAHLDILTRGSRTVAGPARRGWFGTLVAVEFALAVILLSGAGLLFGSYRHLQAVETGVVPDRIGTARIVLPLTTEWSVNEVRRRFHDRLLERLRAQPFIESAGLVARLPLDPAAGGIDVTLETRPERTEVLLLQMASPGYFETVKADLVAGRTFTTGDVEGAPSVVILNDVAAERLFGSDTAVGEAISYDDVGGPVTADVVGVVRATRYGDLTASPGPALYLPTGQATVVRLSLVYRSSVDPAVVVPAIRGVLGELDASATVTLDEVSTLEHRLAQAMARPRFFLVLTGTFAVLALLLASCGIYGTTAFWIGEHWRELGVRVALGASPRQVSRQVVAGGLALAAAGVGAGLVATWLGGELVRRLLFGIEPGDPLTLSAAALALAASGTLATWLSARRVATIDPAVTLRSE